MAFLKNNLPKTEGALQLLVNSPTPTDFNHVGEMAFGIRGKAHLLSCVKQILL